MLISSRHRLHLLKRFLHGLWALLRSSRLLVLRRLPQKLLEILSERCHYPPKEQDERFAQDLGKDVQGGGQLILRDQEQKEIVRGAGIQEWA